jgi:predicted metal-dependent hydrolase
VQDLNDLNAVYGLLVDQLHTLVKSQVRRSSVRYPRGMAKIVEVLAKRLTTLKERASRTTFVEAYTSALCHAPSSSSDALVLAQPVTAEPMVEELTEDAWLEVEAEEEEDLRYCFVPR